MTRTSWLIAFSDLAAVLAAFFVMLLAMSEFDAPNLDRLALVLGSNNGQWQTVPTAAAPPAPAMRRAPVDDDPARDYFATVLAERVARAGWPWTASSVSGGVALRQPLRDGGAVLPAEMVQYLVSTGYPVAVAAIFPADQGRRAGVYGVFDEGLKRAGELAGALNRSGIARAIPVETRFAAVSPPGALEIFLDTAREIGE